MKPLTEWLNECPLVAILRGVRPDEVIDVTLALVQAGFRIVEVPLNSPDPLASIALLAGRFGATILVGAGTVLDPRDVARVADAGGRLVVMPHANADVVRTAKDAGMLAAPGFATPTEAFTMISAGADALKLFPAEASPPAVLRAMKAVLPRETPVLPVGSITPENMGDYWRAGAAGFGLGSALYKPGLNAADVATRARAFRSTLSLLKGDKS